MLKSLPSEVKQFRALCYERITSESLNGYKKIKKVVKYLRSKGVRLPPIISFTKAVEMLTELPEQS